MDAGIRFRLPKLIFGQASLFVDSIESFDRGLPVLRAALRDLIAERQVIAGVNRQQQNQTRHYRGEYRSTYRSSHGLSMRGHHAGSDTNRYPTPRTVCKCFGCDGSSSIYLRSRTTKLSMARVSVSSCKSQ